MKGEKWLGDEGWVTGGSARVLQLGLILLASRSWLAGAPPAIDHYAPHGATPGAAIEIQFHGSGQGEVERVWTSFPCEQERLGVSDQDSAFRIRVRAENGLGLGVMRLVGKQGISAPVLFCLDDLPTVVETGTNNTWAQAQPVEWPVAVDGRLGSQERDYYRFPASKGQGISIEVMAQRLGFKLDPLVRVTDMKGREWVYQDDAPELVPDVRLRWEAPESGDYVLELRDAIYRGGSGFGYRLRLGDFPRVTVTYPMSVKAGAPAEVKCLGPDGEAGEPKTVAVEAPDWGQWMGVRRTPRGGSSLVWIEAAKHAPQLEREPNDEPSQAVEVTVPAVMQGRLERTQDRDWFKLVLPHKGRFVVDGRTRRVGSPCDLWMELQTLEGRRLERVRHSEGGEGWLAYEASEAGPLLLMIEELNRNGGPDFAYELQARYRQPEFLLSVDTDTVQAVPGGTFSMKVQAVRTNSTWNGPIALALEGLSGEVRVEPGAVPEKSAEVEVKVTIPTGLEPGSIHAMRLVGRAEVEGTELSRVARTEAVWRRRFNDAMRLPPGVDGVIMLGVRAGD